MVSLEPSCSEPGGMCIDCMPGAECCAQKGCSCKDGFYRDYSNQCVAGNPDTDC